MHVLLFGGSGQLGSALRHSLLPAATVTTPPRRLADLEDPHSLQRMLITQRPDIIVNAAAYTAVDSAELDERRVQRINVDAVGMMAAYAGEFDALLIHYSSDYIFDGHKPHAYLESDVPNPLNVYGHSKLRSEQAIAARGCRALVLRTSWVYSTMGSNFVRTIIKLAHERRTLNVVDDQIGAPTSARRIADITASAIAAYQRGCLNDGVYHLSATGRTSWHGLACHIVNSIHAHGINTPLRADAILPVASKDYPQAAIRPHNSLLDTGKLCGALRLSIPDWKVDIDDTLDRLLSG